MDNLNYTRQKNKETTGDQKNGNFCYEMTKYAVYNNLG